VNPSALVVLPTYNERDNITAVAEGVMAHPGLGLLIVDDASPDGTGEVADELADRFGGRIQVMHRTGRRGLGLSCRDGFAEALRQPVELVCQMDADLSHDPARLPALIAAVSDADVAIGSRYVPGGAIVNWPRRRRVLSRFANLYVRGVTRLDVRDCTSGFRCWRRAALEKIPLDRVVSDGYSFLIETLYMAVGRGCRVTEVPITFVERRLGASKLSAGVLIESLLTPWRLVARAPRG
jgi:dolichol-phosphate mannosyltransferase